MAGTPSTSATFKVAKQASKGTPASTGFVTGMMTHSELNPGIDKITKTAEHGVTYSRATAHKTPSRRGSYLARGSYRGYLYPDLLGMMLLGTGFGVTTTGASANKTHTFKLANRDAYSWLTVLHALDGNKERRASDVRGTRLMIDGTPDGVMLEGDFVGLTLGEAAGTETTTAEDTTGELLPTEGTLTLTYEPAAYDARVSADMAALSTVCTVGASSVAEQTARIAQGAQTNAPVTAQIVTVNVRPLAEAPKK